MSKEEEIAEMARVHVARRKERAALENKMDELCPVSDKDNYAARKEKLDVTRYVLDDGGEHTGSSVARPFKQKARPEGKNGRCPGRANADYERHAAYDVYGTGSLKIELKTDSNDAKRASKTTDAKVGEAREKLPRRTYPSKLVRQPILEPSYQSRCSSHSRITCQRSAKKTKISSRTPNRKTADARSGS